MTVHNYDHITVQTPSTLPDKHHQTHFKPFFNTLTLETQPIASMSKARLQLNQCPMSKRRRCDSDSESDDEAERDLGYDLAGLRSQAACPKHA